MIEFWEWLTEDHLYEYIGAYMFLALALALFTGLPVAFALQLHVDVRQQLPEEALVALRDLEASPLLLLLRQLLLLPPQLRREGVGNL